jgi:hypothetical protein
MTPFVYAEQHTCGSTYGEDTRSVRRHDARKGKKEKKNIYIYIYYTISQNSPDYDNCP